MKLEIDKDLSLAYIGHRFSEQFKYLKLEFFSKGHHEGEGSQKNDLLPGSTAVGEIGTKVTEGTFIFDKYITVAEFEQLFEEKFGIHVQVFRKAGDSWLETTKTDGWTLHQQNERGAGKETPIDPHIDTYEVD